MNSNATRLRETSVRQHLLRPLALAALVMSAVGGIAADNAGPTSASALARQILDTAGLNGGLIVHLGCGDGQLTAALHAGGSFVVQGLTASANDVRQAREQLRQLGVYGPVSVERFAGPDLPYADNLVNLLVVAADAHAVASNEILRVLAPRGTAVFLDAQAQLNPQRWTKPRPAAIDEWTHYAYDAGGNPVAHDDVVAPPGRLQWTAGPLYMRSHEHIPGLYALVSSGGRLFYIVDDAPIGSIRATPRWLLVARDAFNGLPLWQRPVGDWFPHIVNWGATPPQLERRLVAVGNRVYVTLGLHAPLSVLDAATGEAVQVIPDTRGTEEINWHQGVLLLTIRSVTEERAAELTRWQQLVAQPGSPLEVRETAEPLVKGLRSTEAKGSKSVLALDAASGRVLWKKADDAVSGLRAGSLCASGERVFYQNGRDVVCVDLKSGREQWSAAAPPLRVVHGDTVYCADGQAITALAADTGQPRWKQDTLLTQILDVFVAGGSLWEGGFKPMPGKRGPSWGPYFVTQRELATGKMLRHVEPENPSHHHRCYSNKATDRYILGGRRGTEFIDLNSGEVLWNSWARGVCKYGVMPANGLLYVPPHACACYVAAKLTGFNALAPVGGKAEGRTQKAEGEAERLERGPAYAPIRNPQSAIRNSPAWPTYRGDAQRSGVTRSPISAVLRQRWQTPAGQPLTPPTVSDGQVFVATVDAHQVAALDADSGQPRWQFTAGARVDSPPTLHEGHAIFGCSDGSVYSVRQSDGALAWRLRAARTDRRITANGQLESVSPAHGSVLVQDGVAYVTTGRSSYLDGGIDLCRVDTRTGQVLSRTPIYSPDPETGRQPPQSAPASMPGVRTDILSSDGGYVYLRDTVFDPLGGQQTGGNPHLFALTAFRDGAWAHRAYWIFGRECSIATGCSGRDKQLIYGRLLVFNDTTIYGYGRGTVHWSNALQDGPYRLFAVQRGEATSHWTKSLPIQARAMLLADQVLFVAGPPVSVGLQSGPPAAGREAVLLALAAADGAELARYPLAGLPVFDGLAAAGGRLYVALEQGAVVCFDGQPVEKN